MHHQLNQTQSGTEVPDGASRQLGLDSEYAMLCGPLSRLISYAFFGSITFEFGFKNLRHDRH